MKFYEKGTLINIWGEFFSEEFRNSEDYIGEGAGDDEIEITLGEDILTANADYTQHNGLLCVSEDDLDVAVQDYMDEKYPEWTTFSWTTNQDKKESYQKYM